MDVDSIIPSLSIYKANPTARSAINEIELNRIAHTKMFINTSDARHICWNSFRQTNRLTIALSLVL